MPAPPPLYYFCAWTDSGCLCGCVHFHMTVASAVVCSESDYAGAYVIAVEKGEYRELNTTEEADFQALTFGKSRERKPGFVLLPFPMPKTVE